MGHFRFLEEIVLADCAVEVSADSLSDLFETAARALAELMVDPATLEASVTRHLTLEAPSLDLLLFEWLSDLIARKDAEAEVFARTEVRVTDEGPSRLEARLIGGPIVTGRTGRRSDVKGLTFHRFMIERVAGGWHATFVLDL